MKTSFTPSKLIALLIMMCFFALSVSAQNKKLSVQGFLKDGNGKAVDNGTYELTFKLYTTISGGSALWTEVNPAVKVFGGIYSVQLGGITNISLLAWNVPYFLGVTIQGTELSPRTELTYAPYAFNVNKSTLADTALVVKCSGAVGDVKYSILDPTQFAAVNGNCWVPMDGRAMVSTDKLRIITNASNVPNGGGLFLRSQEFSGTDNDKDRTNASTIAQVQAEATKAHTHTGTAGGITSSPIMNAGSFFNTSFKDDGQNQTYNGSGTHVNNIPYGSHIDGPILEDGLGSPNIRFTRANAQVTLADHSHNVAIGTTTGTETRPANMNFWVYIRIN